MKKSDIAMIVLISSVSVMVSFFVVNSLPFFTAPEEGVEVRTIEPISADVAEPDTAVFNSEAINPTIRSVIGRGGPADN